MEISCRLSTAEDAAYVAANIRPEDAAEVYWGSGGSISDILEGQVFCNEGGTFTLIRDGVPCAMFGLVDDFGEEAVIWFMGTPLSTDRKACRAWLQLAPAVLEYFHRSYSVLYNTVWKGNATHIRWLARSGAEFSEIPQLGPDFLMFQIKEDTVDV